MSEYPKTGFLKEFVRRIYINLNLIEETASKDKDKAYETTQLLNSLFGLIIVPEQKYYNCLQNIPNKDVPIFMEIKSKIECCDIKTLNYQGFIKHLRNCISHPNHMEFLNNNNNEIKQIKLIDKDGNKSTFSIQLEIEELKSICHELCGVLIEKLDNLEGK